MKPLPLFFLKLITIKSVCVLCLINVCQPWQKEGHAGNSKAALLALHEHACTSYATKNYAQQPWIGCIQHAVHNKESASRTQLITAICIFRYIYSAWSGKKEVSVLPHPLFNYVFTYIGSLDFPGVYGLKWCDCKSLLLFILTYDFCYKILIQISNQLLIIILQLRMSPLTPPPLLAHHTTK